MNDDDIERIELALDVSLPDEYKALLRADPFGGGYWGLYGDAKEIIEHNGFMRHEGYVRPWPMNWLIIGDDGAGNDHFLDLNLSASPVFFLDHELYYMHRGLDGAVREAAPNLEDHLNQVKEDVRSFLEDDGYPVDGDPAEALRQFRQHLDVRLRNEEPPTSIDETLTEALSRLGIADQGIRRIGSIRMLPKEIAAISDLWFEVFFDVCRIVRLSGEGGVDVWLWRDDRATDADTVVLAAGSVDQEAARAVVIGALPLLPVERLR